MQGRGKNIVILGAGESGIGATHLALKQGWNVFVSDFGIIKPNFKQELEQLGVEWEEGRHDETRILHADLIIKSPGIPDKSALIKAVKNRGVKMISEIEFAGYYLKAKTIGITGSNGKTTTTLLLHHILTKAGFNVGLAGNVGQSLAKQVAYENYDWYVLELSSFQLDDMVDFRINIAIMTNITPDHLDRYDYKIENYVASKFRILQNQTNEDWIIYNLDDPTLRPAFEKLPIVANRAPFSLQSQPIVGGFATIDTLVINIKDPFTMSIHELALKGKHNTQNSLASGIASRLLEVRNDSLRESLSDFENVEHRLEFVAKVNGIEFINDSKATNVNSTWYALESMTKPTVWIVGGVDKGNDYNELLELVKDKVTAIICLGTDNSKIIQAFSGQVETIVEARSALEAVAYGYRLAKKDQTVLLSPCCASFDLFENYEDRGDQFKIAVKSL
jgi:UDP-N-acetylmuramoylalanine--D-glutamate ligase